MILLLLLFTTVDIAATTAISVLFFVFLQLSDLCYMLLLLQHLYNCFCCCCFVYIYVCLSIKSLNTFICHFVVFFFIQHPLSPIDLPLHQSTINKFFACNYCYIQRLLMLLLLFNAATIVLFIIVVCLLQQQLQLLLLLLEKKWQLLLSLSTTSVVFFFFCQFFCY